MQMAMMAPSGTCSDVPQYCKIWVHATISNGTMAASCHRELGVAFVGGTGAHKDKKVPAGGNAKAGVDEPAGKTHKRRRYG